MSYQVSGTVDVEEVDNSHTEPVSADVGTIPAGTSKRVGVGVFKNTGNVDQTVSVTAANPVNCTAENLQFEEGTTKLGSTVTLAPNQELQLFATVHADDFTPGSGDQPLTFDITTTWS